MNNRQFGNFGEEIACKYLLDNGYKIIARNVHYSRFCELDIIAEYKKTLVFVEVKTRKNEDFGTCMDAITKTKYQNIKKGIFFYLQENPSYKKFRIDAISIILNPKTEINHLKNI